MKKILLLMTFALLFLGNVHAQHKYGTRQGTITFNSEAQKETIKATNNTVSAVIDPKTKRVQFAVLIKGFQFKKALMQEHFNENYMESSKFPKATFKGEIVDGDIDFYQIGTYQVQVKGKLTIHGVTKEVTVPATITMSKDGAKANATFEVAVADYGIEIPSMVKDKIAKVITIHVDALLPML
ncbi:MAG TPA: YceI family protein [Saprospiraceae bacterium]|nr:YceI family protein [Saprospiraceae bacterium]